MAKHWMDQVSDTHLSTSDGLVTYEEAARWLPADIREAIEVSQPCSPGMVDTGHLWSQEYVFIRSPLSTQIRKWWECSLCHITAREDPRPVASMARLLEKGF